MKTEQKHGFTIVELMVVVLCIGVLAALGIPAYRKAIDVSQEKVCINNLRIIDSAKSQWATETGAADTATPRANDLKPYISKRAHLNLTSGAGSYVATVLTLTKSKVSLASIAHFDPFGGRLPGTEELATVNLATFNSIEEPSQQLLALAEDTK